MIEQIQKKSNVVISVPHSGLEFNNYKKYFHNNVKLEQDVDHYVNKLFDIDKINCSYIKSHLIRIVTDLNRKKETAFFHWKRNTLNEKIIKKYPEKEDLKYWDLYYDFLIKMSGKNKLLLDLHSMPSCATKFHLSKNPHQDIERPDICISDTNKNYKFTKIIADIFRKKFKDVRINDPYFGGNISKQMCSKYKYAIQIEINRKLYLDEKTKKMNNNLDITDILNDIIENFK